MAENESKPSRLTYWTGLSEKIFTVVTSVVGGAWAAYVFFNFDVKEKEASLAQTKQATLQLELANKQAELLNSTQVEAAKLGVVQQRVATAISQATRDYEIKGRQLAVDVQSLDVGLKGDELAFGRKPRVVAETGLTLVCSERPGHYLLTHTFKLINSSQHQVELSWILTIYFYGVVQFSDNPWSMSIINQPDTQATEQGGKHLDLNWQTNHDSVKWQQLDHSGYYFLQTRARDWLRKTGFHFKAGGATGLFGKDQNTSDTEQAYIKAKEGDLIGSVTYFGVDGHVQGANVWHYTDFDRAKGCNGP